MRAHQVHATAAFISALASLTMFGLSVAGLLWHWRGATEHRESLLKFKEKEPPLISEYLE